MLSMRRPPFPAFPPPSSENKERWPLPGPPETSLIGLDYSNVVLLRADLTQLTLHSRQHMPTQARVPPTPVRGLLPVPQPCFLPGVDSYIHGTWFPAFPTL